MFDIGFQELIIIFVISLLVFGPEKLPEISRTLGRWVIEIRRGIHEAKSQMENEFKEIDPRVEEDVNRLIGKVKTAAGPEDEPKTEPGDSADDLRGKDGGV